MQFLRLIFVRKLQGASPPDPHRGRCPLHPHWGPSAAPKAPTFQLTFPFLIPMPDIAQDSEPSTLTTELFLGLSCSWAVPGLGPGFKCGPCHTSAWKHCVLVASLVTFIDSDRGRRTCLSLKEDLCKDVLVKAITGVFAYVTRALLFCDTMAQI